MVEQGTVLVGPAVLVLVAVALVLERLWPAERRPIGARGHRQDAAYLALYVVVAVPAVTLIGTGAASLVLRLDGGVTLHPLAVLPGWALVVSGVGGDGLRELGLASAEPPRRLVLALPRAASLAGGTEHPDRVPRAHPLVHTSFQLAAVPLIVLGTGGAVPASVLVAYVVLSTLPHANVNWRLGPLRYVLVTPAYHRLHHDRADRRGVNLGTVLVLWDLLAGLAVFPEPRSAPVKTGLAGRPLPVEQDPAGAGWALDDGPAAVVAHPGQVVDCCTRSRATAWRRDAPRWREPPVARWLGATVAGRRGDAVALGAAVVAAT